ncbi:hypothetical protein J6590_074594 [Homalodisca vitripennis]|nr:hypothetical protein J6590_074594 [Homalodisca vitripennis]
MRGDRWSTGVLSNVDSETVLTSNLGCNCTATEVDQNHEAMIQQAFITYSHYVLVRGNVFLSNGSLQFRCPDRSPLDSILGKAKEQS